MTKPNQPTDTESLPARVSVNRAAAYLDVSHRTVRRYIADGQLRATRIGPRLIRIDRESLLKLATPVGGAA
jgi:excisionase family DNA binding protein